MKDIIINCLYHFLVPIIVSIITINLTLRKKLKSKIPYLKRNIFYPNLELATNLYEPNVFIFDINLRVYTRDDCKDIYSYTEYKRISYDDLNVGDSIFTFENGEDKEFLFTGIINKYGIVETIDDSVIPITEVLSQNKIYAFRCDKESVPKAFLGSFNGKSIEYKIIGTRTSKYKGKTVIKTHKEY